MNDLVFSVPFFGSNYDDIIAKEDEKEAKAGAATAAAAAAAAANSESTSVERQMSINPDKLAWDTHFSTLQVKQLHASFYEAARKTENPKRLQRSQFLDVMESHGATLTGPVERIFKVCDNDETGTISFTEFVLALSVLSQGSPMEKFKLSFEVFDVDETGKISHAEMLSVLAQVDRCAQNERDAGSAAASLHSREEKLRTLVDRIFADADRTKDGTLTFAEYLKAVLKHEWLVRFDVKDGLNESDGAACVASKTTALRDF